MLSISLLTLSHISDVIEEPDLKSVITWPSIHCSERLLQFCYTDCWLAEGTAEFVFFIVKVCLKSDFYVEIASHGCCFKGGSELGVEPWSPAFPRQTAEPIFMGPTAQRPARARTRRSAIPAAAAVAARTAGSDPPVKKVGSRAQHAGTRLTAASMRTAGDTVSSLHTEQRRHFLLTCWNGSK